MSLGEQLIYGSARAAMTCYFATLFALALLGDADRRWVRARRFWTVGWLFYLAHVAAAFHFEHHWSHAEAAASTDFRTAILLGFEAPGGIYFNYAFTLLWTIDVLWWRLLPQSYTARPRGVTWFLHGFFFLMAFNAVIVFGHGLTRWMGAAAIVALAAATAVRSLQSSTV